MTGAAAARVARRSGRASDCAEAPRAAPSASATVTIAVHEADTHPSVRRLRREMVRAKAGLLRGLRWGGGGLVEVAQRVVEAQRTQRSEVDAAGGFQLLRFLELLERCGRLVIPSPVNRHFLEAALLERRLDLPDAGGADGDRRSGEVRSPDRKELERRCRSAASRALGSVKDAVRPSS